jgi:nicotinate-nucleotide--dimethylbenzimidazole phosphoribosyltransferase
MFVFAGDHGIAEEGVSAYPAEVTGQMVNNFLDGGAAINVLCRHHGIDMRIVDMGVNADLDAHPDLIDRKIRRGTRNFALEPAMTRAEAVRALEAGMQCVFDAHARQPLHILGLGEMGIGNTTSASAIISAVTGIAPEAATGRGTGIDDAGVRHKARVIRNVLAFHRPDPGDGLDVLCKVGGFEIAGIAGAALAAAAIGVAVVLDGVISTAAGLIAHLIRPEIDGYLISGHRSVEVAQRAALDTLGLKPVVDLDMRRGEGTGAALTINIVGAACRIMREMASFDEAGVSKKG